VDLSLHVIGEHEGAEKENQLYIFLREGNRR